MAIATSGAESVPISAVGTQRHGSLAARPKRRRQLPVNIPALVLVVGGAVAAARRPGGFAWLDSPSGRLGFEGLKEWAQPGYAQAFVSWIAWVLLGVTARVRRRRVHALERGEHVPLPGAVLGVAGAFMTVGRGAAASPTRPPTTRSMLRATMPTASTSPCSACWPARSARLQVPAAAASTPVRPSPFSRPHGAARPQIRVMPATPASCCSFLSFPERPEQQRGQTMNDTTMTIVGNLVDSPKLRKTKSGHFVANFRVASTPRRYDREQGGWVDGDDAVRHGHLLARARRERRPVAAQGPAGGGDRALLQREYERDETLRPLTNSRRSRSATTSAGG